MNFSNEIASEGIKVTGDAKPSSRALMAPPDMGMVFGDAL
jgi:hypothetical protein